MSKDVQNVFGCTEQSHFEKLNKMGFYTSMEQNQPSCSYLSFTKDDFASSEWKKGDFMTEKWLSASFTVNEAINKFRNHEIAFVNVRGENAIKMKNVKLLINDVAVSSEAHERSTGNPGVDNIYCVSVNGSPKPNDRITICAEVMTDGGLDSEGIIHIYPADLRN